MFLSRFTLLCWVGRDFAYCLRCFWLLAFKNWCSQVGCRNSYYISSQFLSSRGGDSFGLATPQGRPAGVRTPSWDVLHHYICCGNVQFHSIRWTLVSLIWPTGLPKAFYLVLRYVHELMARILSSEHSLVIYRFAFSYPHIALMSSGHAQIALHRPLFRLFLLQVFAR